MKAKPFVKWAGGKGRILTTLEDYLPADFDRQKDITYIEPFVGGGAMLFHMLQNHNNIGKVVINDINSDLISCYQLIKDDPYGLITALEECQKCYWEVSSKSRLELYHAYRDQYNSNVDNKVQRASLFIFLNRTCFNGLYRVNNYGKFNVPMGSYKKPTICDKQLLLRISELLRNIDFTILNGDYSKVRRHLARKHTNFIYFDPPYRPLSNTSYFKEYSNSPFGDAQQVELKKFCDSINKDGTYMLISNSDSKDEFNESYFEKLFNNYIVKTIMAPRTINAFATSRGPLSEVLIRNYSEIKINSNSML